MRLFHKHDWETVNSYHGKQVATNAQLTVWLQICKRCERRQRIQEYGTWPLEDDA